MAPPACAVKKATYSNVFSTEAMPPKLSTGTVYCIIIIAANHTQYISDSPPWREMSVKTSKGGFPLASPLSFLLGSWFPSQGGRHHRRPPFVSEFSFASSQPKERARHGKFMFGKTRALHVRRSAGLLSLTELSTETFQNTAERQGCVGEGCGSFYA